MDHRLSRRRLPKPHTKGRQRSVSGPVQASEGDLWRLAVRPVRTPGMCSRELRLDPANHSATGGARMVDNNPPEASRTDRQLESPTLSTIDFVGISAATTFYSVFPSESGPVSKIGAMSRSVTTCRFHRKTAVAGPTASRPTHPEKETM